MAKNSTRPVGSAFKTTKSESSDKKSRKGAGFATTGSLFAKYQVADSGGYISQEFQDFGYRLAVELDDLKHKSLYMRLAKKEPRQLLERARSFVSDAHEVKSKARLFMWKIKQLKAEQSEKTSSKKQSTQAEQLSFGAVDTEEQKD